MGLPNVVSQRSQVEFLTAIHKIMVEDLCPLDSHISLNSGWEKQGHDDCKTSGSNNHHGSQLFKVPTGQKVNVGISSLKYERATPHPGAHTNVATVGEILLLLGA